jgi:EAL domain-containing protein (putative c-di-GMP-specific phosphodiesterase class I)
MEVLRNPIHIGGRDLTVTASIGIVVAGGAYRGDAESVLRDADTAMYRAKESGRNRFVVFEADFHSRTINRLSMETELRDGLNLKQFEVYYQPVVDPRNGQPVGAEALVRWHHPTRGMVSPSEFIPVAEETALIVPLGEWVFSTALTQLGEWDNAADGPSLDSLAVNVSARQLDDPAAISAMMRLLEQHGIDPVRFSVEVTESAVMVESETTRRSLFDLKEFGLRVSIDDFGTGYSSLAYLHTLPVTTVKVDRSFVKRMGTAEDSTPVVRAIVDMSHALGLDVVAEGVSSEELRHRVVLTGCDRAQGYLWAKPMPAAEFAAWWRAANQLALVGVR